MFAPPTGVAKLDQDTDDHKLASRARQLVAEPRIDELLANSLDVRSGWMLGRSEWVGFPSNARNLPGDRQRHCDERG
jgi:hypothetical protein